jgi:hypothetical protein
LTEYQFYSNSYLLACDRCNRNEAIATAKTVEQAQRIAADRFRWATGTPHGDLCPACASLHRHGVLDGAR